jgi:hypothetical protein
MAATESRYGTVEERLQDLEDALNLLRRQVQGINGAAERCFDQLEARADALEAYLPMLARLAAFEEWTARTIGATITRMENTTDLDPEDPSHELDLPPYFDHLFGKTEETPAGAKALLSEYNEGSRQYDRAQAQP